MTNDLKELIERSRSVRMSKADEEEQRRSFAFGSAKIENEEVTREMIDEAAQRIDSERNGG